MNQKSLFVMGGVSLLAATAIIVTQTNCKTGGEGDAPAPNDTGKLTTPSAPGTTAAALVAGESWPMWGRDGTGNLFSPETGIASNFDPGKFVRGSEEIDMATTKNVRWAAKLGSQAYGNTTVSGGKVFVGTNNETPRDKRHIGDRGNVYCLDEKTGELLWQLVVPKLGAGKVSDWEYRG